MSGMPFALMKSLLVCFAASLAILGRHVAAIHVAHLGPNRIPAQLVLTAKGPSVDDLPPALKMNVLNTISQNSNLHVRFLGDEACQKYIATNYDDELSRLYAAETRGMNRGDLCRAAVLAKEGGFYVDLDVQMKYPLSSLVDTNTTFMSAFSHFHGQVLNAIMAATPGNAIVTESVQQIRKHYLGHKLNAPDNSLGPASVTKALGIVAAKLCKDRAPLTQATPSWSCGQENLRMYKELGYMCSIFSRPDNPRCPQDRIDAMANYVGARFGLFTAPPDNRIVGWSRFAGCMDDGCQLGGHSPEDEGPRARMEPVGYSL